MAWTDMARPRVGQLADAAYFSTLKANLEHLQNRPAASYHHPGSGSDYTTTTQIGEPLDAANFSLAINSSGGVILAMCALQVRSSANQAVYLSIVRVDADAYIGYNLELNYDVECSASNTEGRPMAWIRPFVGLPAGSYTFRVMWRVSAGTGTCLVKHRPFFAVWEM